uniref:Retrotransposon gag domain-containing protein n=1 Tax=Nicotiana tabacum TaxID=4097 RepID=A0A1S4BQ00_TOBAC|nr:PREDICTED: uncharacterized protein LOC107810665 [Nicotiana tabacum]
MDLAHPPSPDSPDFKLWSICNDMVLSWLLNSLSKEIVGSIIYSRTTRDRFGQSNGVKLFHLQKDLNDLVQGSNDIAGYFTKVKRLWDELDTLNVNISCECDCTCGAICGSLVPDFGFLALSSVAVSLF